MSEHLETFANQWTPETGFASNELKHHKLGYPRPTAGKVFPLSVTSKSLLEGLRK